jgi:hypothetical protein
LIVNYLEDNNWTVDPEKAINLEDLDESLELLIFEGLNKVEKEDEVYWQEANRPLAAV